VTLSAIVRQASVVEWLAFVALASHVARLAITNGHLACLVVCAIVGKIVAVYPGTSALAARHARQWRSRVTFFTSLAKVTLCVSIAFNAFAIVLASLAKTMTLALFAARKIKIARLAFVASATALILVAITLTRSLIA
jgi:hypothetical protein